MSNTVASKIRSWAVPVGIILIAGLLIAILVLQMRGESNQPTATTGQEEAEDYDFTSLEARNENDVQSRGPVDAPVGLIVYSDYQCPFCAKWSHDALPEMIELADRGDLRIEWRDINMYGPNSERASLAANAAGQQGKFWEYHELLFPEGEKLPAEQLSEEHLTALAAELGLDIERFTADLHSPEILAEIENHAEQARHLGVSGTPTFILGGEPLVGAQPASVFTDMFERALEAAE